MRNKTLLTYKSAGVSYDAMDPLKRMAQREGKNTTHNFDGSGFRELSHSRGESAYIIENNESYFAFVEEGLGTKNLVADAMYPITKKTYYDDLAQDTVAMMVNDLITVGAKPLTVLAYWAAGSAEWFENKERMEDLVCGWADACDMSGAVWGGGETPTLTGVIEKNAIDLGGACFGSIHPKSRLVLGEKLEAGDAIILFASSGIHANGLSLARKIAGKLPDAYATRISDGRMYGEALLDPTILYAKLVQDLFLSGVDIHYMSNITGHGWRKLMRHTKSLTYLITTIPPVPPVLQFMIEKGPIAENEAYGNLNMGAGYALFAPVADIKLIQRIARKHSIKTYDAGRVEKGKKQVIIEPKKIIFEGTSLQVRE